MATKKTAAKKTTTNTASNAGAGAAKAKSFYYVVYVDSYRNDTTIVPRGIYRSKNKIERFERLSNKFVESFEGKIPSAKIYKLAESLRITTTDESGDFRDADKVLAEMVQELA